MDKYASNSAFHMEDISASSMRDGLVFHDAKLAPFRLYGVFHDGAAYRRVPADVAAATNPGVVALSKHTAGGRVRFITDSPYVVIKCKWRSLDAMTHMPLTGSAGFDLYSYKDGKEDYRATCRPAFGSTEGFDAAIDLPCAELRTLNLNMPLYNGVSELYIGIKEGSVLMPAPDYKYERPIVYYGSSITQGGCASRPGMAYQARVTRHFDINHINLGFSGSAKAEDAIADYIAGLDMSAFVYDYDHNAPTVEHLEATHEKMFLKIREKNPTLPIIMMSAPVFAKNDVWTRRNEIIRGSYERALARGDKNVYFIDGTELALDLDTTVDGCHPNDYGFVCMANRLIKELEKIIK